MKGRIYVFHHIKLYGTYHVHLQGPIKWGIIIIQTVIDVGQIRRLDYVY